MAQSFGLRHFFLYIYVFEIKGMKKKIIRCEDSSPTYRQIIKEVNKGWKFIPCEKTNKIIRVVNNG